MQVLVLSDTHDNIWNLRKLIESEKKNIDALIFCGDMIAPFTAGIMSEFDVPSYVCLGNNDEDHIGMLKKAGSAFTWTHLSQEFGEVELDNRKIAFCHYPRLAELLADTDKYDAVFHGHTHLVCSEEIKGTILCNPGAVCGIRGGEPARASYALYDTETNWVEIFDIE